MNSLSIRQKLVDILDLDLVGPSVSADAALQAEILREMPIHFYLGGFLMPRDAKEREVEGSDEELNAAPDQAAPEVVSESDRVAAKRAKSQASMGLSVLVPPGVSTLSLSVTWGEYTKSETPRKFTVLDNASGKEVERDLRSYWTRSAKSSSLSIDLTKPHGKLILPASTPNSGSGELFVEYVVREASTDGFDPGLPKGCRSVSVFLLNDRKGKNVVELTVFQVEMRLRCQGGFQARHDLRGPSGVMSAMRDDDDDVADLHFRDIKEYAVGHGVSAEAIVTGGNCEEVKSVWIPTAEVERVEPRPMNDKGVELKMEKLAAIPDGESAKKALMPLVVAYREWIEQQRAGLDSTVGKNSDRRRKADELINNARFIAQRIENGINLLAQDAQALDAFKVANASMAAANRQRSAFSSAGKVSDPAWRPFQLAFVLQSLLGIAQPEHEDRERVELLFFPTGGGKTEAYLGLAAFTMVLRRLRNPGEPAYAGVSVLMRYTLRLLTIDQLGRAAGLVCALELEREKRTDLGSMPFEVGLWVGSAATPNTLGSATQRGEHTALGKVAAFRDDGKTLPIPIESCPWCGTKFDTNSFHFQPDNNAPRNLVISCSNRKCDFHNVSKRPLPIVGVDEPLYRRLPAFVIATLDKFASLPWTGQVGALFGKVSSYDAIGRNHEFYGPADSERGKPIPTGQLLPPDLIIQDELHLISGPLGTIAGLYEGAIEKLCERHVPGREQPILPKVVASTATVRKASSQIRALFGRNKSAVFPPPGPDRKDSFFAITLPSGESPARLYVGVSFLGRNPKDMMMRVSTSLMSAALKCHNDNPPKLQGDPKKKAEYQAANRDAWLAHEADPYMTLLAYYNSLKELGGSGSIFQDTVTKRLSKYRARDYDRLEPRLSQFANRKLEGTGTGQDVGGVVKELTSRVSTADVAETKRRLAQPFGSDDGLDVALATNMISVGLDITRLGLLMVMGQPKTTAEYIQTTSRVGRERSKPGLIVTILNSHRPRDRSHYERFPTYHASFYRSVEASSVTPYSPRAMDRALSSALVGLMRHYLPVMTPAGGAHKITEKLPAEKCEEFSIYFATRAMNHAVDMPETDRKALYDKVFGLCREIYATWHELAKEGTKLQYQQEVQNVARLLQEFLQRDADALSDKQKKFRSNRSMRDVERVVVVNAKKLNR